MVCGVGCYTIGSVKGVREVSQDFFTSDFTYSLFPDWYENGMRGKSIILRN